MILFFLKSPLKITQKGANFFSSKQTGIMPRLVIRLVINYFSKNTKISFFFFKKSVFIIFEFRGWSVTWIPKKSILNYGKYKSFKEINKNKDPTNPKYAKESINYKLDKYLIFVTEGSKMKLFDPMSDFYYFSLK